MTKVYFIDGKKVDLDSSEWDLIYKDGQWNSRGVNLFFRKKDNIFILESWSNWQSERSGVELKTREEAIEYLNNQSYKHPKRVDETFQKIRYIPEVF